MKELKLRAWDGFNECYYYSEGYQSLSKFFNICEKCKEGGNGITYELCTGEQDFSKKELYVGDIVEIHFNQNSPNFMGSNPMNFTTHTCIIEFNEFTRSFSLRNLTPKIRNRHNFGVIGFNASRLIRDQIIHLGNVNQHKIIT